MCFFSEFTFLAKHLSKVLPDLPAPCRVYVGPTDVFSIPNGPIDNVDEALQRRWKAVEASGSGNYADNPLAAFRTAREGRVAVSPSMAMGGLIGPRLLCPVPVAPTPSAGSPRDGRSVRAQGFFLFFFSHHPDAITPSVITPYFVGRD